MARRGVFEQHSKRQSRSPGVRLQQCLRKGHGGNNKKSSKNNRRGKETRGTVFAKISHKHSWMGFSGGGGELKKRGLRKRKGPQGRTGVKSMQQGYPTQRSLRSTRGLERGRAKTGAWWGEVQNGKESGKSEISRQQQQTGGEDLSGGSEKKRKAGPGPKQKENVSHERHGATSEEASRGFHDE